VKKTKGPEVSLSGNADARSLFVVHNGTILVHGIVGVFTEASDGAQGGVAVNANLDHGGTNLCTVTDVDDQEVGTLISITGTVSDALLVGSVVNFPSKQLLLGEGTMKLELSDYTDSTGKIQFYLFWSPVEDGAYVLSA